MNRRKEESTDVFSVEKRSEVMSRIGARNTKPEITVRKALFSLGFRYRLHVSRLPGKPDMVFPKYKSVIFVHGCFWHGHKCHLFKWPHTNRAFWRKKIERNRVRDVRDKYRLRDAGWRVMVVWECAVRGSRRLSSEEVAYRCALWLKRGVGDDSIEGTTRKNDS